MDGAFIAWNAIGGVFWLGIGIGTWLERASSKRESVRVALGYEEDATEPSRPYRPKIDDHQVQFGYESQLDPVRVASDPKVQPQSTPRHIPWRIRRKQLEAAHRTKRKHAEDLEKP